VQYKSMNFMKVLGRVNKFSTFKVRRKSDKDFVLFAKGYDYNYANAKPNYKASVQGIFKYDRDYNRFSPDKDSFDKAFRWLEYDFGHIFAGSEFISLQASVDHLDLSTSPGFPHNIHHRNKKTFLEEGGISLLRDYDESLDYITSPTCCFGSALKEEIRKKSKLSINDIRQINAAPVQHVVSLNRYCLKQNESFYSSHLECPSVVGLNPFDGGWNALAEKLLKHSNTFEDDAKKFDSSFIRPIFEAIRDFRWRHISTQFDETDQRTKHKKRFYTLYEDIINTVFIQPDGYIIQKYDGGNPSGTSNTIVDNTLAMCLLYYYSYARAGFSYLEFKENVELCVVGDDSVRSCSDLALARLPAESLHSYFKELGVELKGHLDARGLKFVSFLGNQFICFDDVWLPKCNTPNKLVSSLALRASGASPADKLSRALAVNVLLCTSSEEYNLVNRYVLFLIDKYGKLLINNKRWNEALRMVVPREYNVARFLPKLEGGRSFKKSYNGQETIRQRYQHFQTGDEKKNVTKCSGQTESKIFCEGAEGGGLSGIKFKTRGRSSSFSERGEKREVEKSLQCSDGTSLYSQYVIETHQGLCSYGRGDEDYHDRWRLNPESEFSAGYFIGSSGIRYGHREISRSQSFSLGDTERILHMQG